MAESVNETTAQCCLLHLRQRRLTIKVEEWVQLPRNTDSLFPDACGPLRIASRLSHMGYDPHRIQRTAKLCAVRSRSMLIGTKDLVAHASVSITCPHETPSAASQKVPKEEAWDVKALELYLRRGKP